MCSDSIVDIICWFSGMRWGGMSKPSIMSWHVGSVNFICNFILIGPHGQTKPEARSGNEITNKNQMIQVPTIPVSLSLLFLFVYGYLLHDSIYLHTTYLHILSFKFIVKLHIQVVYLGLFTAFWLGGVECYRGSSCWVTEKYFPCVIFINIKYTKMPSPTWLMKWLSIAIRS